MHLRRLRAIGATLCAAIIPSTAVHAATGAVSLPSYGSVQVQQKDATGRHQVIAQCSGSFGGGVSASDPGWRFDCQVSLDGGASTPMTLQSTTPLSSTTCTPDDTQRTTTWNGYYLG